MTKSPTFNRKLLNFVSLLLKQYAAEPFVIGKRHLNDATPWYRFHIGPPKSEANHLRIRENREEQVLAGKA